jgi:peptidoglycan/LPS O-acetylase OafA/YrhL
MLNIRKFRPDIEVLRAIAVLAVIVAHSKLGLLSGFIGVDIFFVISGFLITRHLHDEVQSTGSISLKSFYSRRILRILPASMCVLLITLLASLIWLSPLQTSSNVWDALAANFSSINNRLAETGTDYFQSTTTPSPFQHFWSLAVEEQFYFIWPLIILLLAKIFVRKLKEQLSNEKTEEVKFPLVMEFATQAKSEAINYDDTAVAATTINGSKIVINPKVKVLDMATSEGLTSQVNAVLSSASANYASTLNNKLGIAATVQYNTEEDAKADASFNNGIAAVTSTNFNLFKVVATIVMLTIIAVSLYLSSVITKESQMWAYFGLNTRAWQLCVGALMAFHLNLFAKIPSKIASCLSWVGFVGLISGFFIITEATAYPGLWALLPTLSTALIVVAGTNLTDWSFERAFNLKYIRGIAKISFSLYLIHWPIFVIIFYQLGDKVQFHDRIAVILISVGLATLSYFTIENPVRYNKSIRTSFKKTIIIGLVLLMIPGAISGEMIYLKNQNDNKYAFASNLKQTTTFDSKKIMDAIELRTLPLSLTLPLDKVPRDNFKNGNCLANTNIELPVMDKNCLMGNVDSKKVIVLLGDSHAYQWSETFADIATKNDYKLVIYTKSGCPMYDISTMNNILKRDYTECYSWREDALVQIQKLKPELIIQTGLTYANSTQEKYKEYIGRLKQISKNVVKIEDTPHPVHNVPECLTKNSSDIKKCSFTLAAATLYKQNRDMETSIAQKDNIQVIDPTDWFCDKTLCPSIIDNIVVYQDSSHVTNTYAKYLSNLMEQKLSSIFKK